MQSIPAVFAIRDGKIADQFIGALPEQQVVAFVQKLIGEGLLTEKAEGRYRNMLIHAIEADRWLQDLSMESKFDTEWSFLTELKARGRRAATAWLAKGFADVGVKSSVDVTVDFL